MVCPIPYLPAFVLQCWINVSKDVQLLMEGCLCLEEVRSALDQSWAQLCQCAETQETSLRHWKHGEHQGCKALEIQSVDGTLHYEGSWRYTVHFGGTNPFLFIFFWRGELDDSNDQIITWHGISHVDGVSYRLAFFLSLCSEKDGHHEMQIMIGRMCCIGLCLIKCFAHPLCFPILHQYMCVLVSFTCMYQQALSHYETMCSRL